MSASCHVRTLLAGLGCLAFIACGNGGGVGLGDGAPRADVGPAADAGPGSGSDAAPGPGPDAAPTGDASPTSVDAAPGADAVASPDAGPSPDAEPSIDAAAADATGPADIGNPDTGPFTLSGAVTYDFVPALDTPNPHLDYPSETARPARRVVVKAIQAGVAIASTTTDDLGHFVLDVPGGAVNVRAVAELSATNYHPDGTPPDACNGASWDVKAVDNTRMEAVYVVDDPTPHDSAASGLSVHAACTQSNGVYTARSAAPFALLDTVLTEFEKMCAAGHPDLAFPPLLIDWSVNNVPTSGDPAMGQVGGTFFSPDQTGMAHIWVLGKADVDTDEYDNHVVAHETGHYMEASFWRSDSPGGGHTDGDSLEPTLAFSEGWGNAVSGMTFDDPVYVDTSGVGQQDGFSFDVSVAPTGDDRGIYSEASLQYFLWSLYENRDPMPHSGSLDRIFQVLHEQVANSPALTNAQNFAAHYNALFGGDAESLRTLWGSGLATPYDSLCAGTCSGTMDAADPWDVDNDIGGGYGMGSASARNYPQGRMGSHYPAEFWQLYRPLMVAANASTAHDRTIFHSYDNTDPSNKFGAIRNYRFVAPSSGAFAAQATHLGAASCAMDVLDMYVYDRGGTIGYDQSSTGTTAGCPRAAFAVSGGQSYVVSVYGFTIEEPHYDVPVAPDRQHGPILVDADQRGVVPAGEPTAVALRLLPVRDGERLVSTVRGIEGLVVMGGEPMLHGPAMAREPITRQVSVRIEAGRAGYLVVEARLLGADGRWAGSTEAFPIASPDSTFTLERPGVLAKGAGGRAIVVQPSR
jgi:hypothetical protein